MKGPLPDCINIIRVLDGFLRVLTTRALVQGSFTLDGFIEFYNHKSLNEGLSLVTIGIRLPLRVPYGLCRVLVTCYYIGIMA